MACDQDSIVSRLLRSYDEVGGINHLDGIHLPSKHAIPAICENLLKLLFPGFLDDEAPTRGEVERLTAERVARVTELLSIEVACCLRSEETDDEGLATLSRKVVCGFLDRLPEVPPATSTGLRPAPTASASTRST